MQLVMMMGSYAGIGMKRNFSNDEVQKYTLDMGFRAICDKIDDIG